MQVVIAHKSKVSYRVDVTGRACHSSRAPLGVNAIDVAAKLIVKIRDIADRLAHAGKRDPLYD
ncbi:peptidase dimerization domain-containing protein, partial [Mycobacterium tuberculosis]|nr:peptidase dimerization domain-containing protein [Mycobacterium tuberculosis]